MAVCKNIKYKGAMYSRQEYDKLIRAERLAARGVQTENERVEEEVFKSIHKDRFLENIPAGKFNELLDSLESDLNAMAVQVGKIKLNDFVDFRLSQLASYTEKKREAASKIEDDDSYRKKKLLRQIVENQAILANEKLIKRKLQDRLKTNSGLSLNDYSRDVLEKEFSLSGMNFEKITWDEDVSITTNAKARQSLELRRFFSTILVRDEDGFILTQPGTNALKYHNSDEVFDTLKMLLVKKYPDLKSMKLELKSQENIIPIIKDVLYRLDEDILNDNNHPVVKEVTKYFLYEAKKKRIGYNSKTGQVDVPIVKKYISDRVKEFKAKRDLENKVIKDQFTIIMSGYPINAYTVMKVFSDQGGVNYRSYKTNSNATSNMILNQWSLSFASKFTYTPEENLLTREFDDDKYLSVHKKIKKRIENAVRQRRVSNEQASDIVFDVMEDLGTPISVDEAFALVERGIFMKNSSYGGGKRIMEFFNELFSDDGPFKRDLELSPESNPFNDNYLKALSKAVGKSTTERRSPTYRDGGKTVYEYMFSQYVFDVFDLFKTNPNLFVQQRQDEFSSSVSWIENFLTYDDYTDDYVIDESDTNVLKMDISTVSLSGLIEKSNSKLDDETFENSTEREREEYAIAQFTKFKDRGEMIRDSLQSRKMTMLLPTFADKKRVHMIDGYPGITVQFKGEDDLEQGLEIETDYLVYAYEQLVLPELKRIRKYQLGEKSADLKHFDKAATLFYLVPSMNTIEELFHPNGLIKTSEEVWNDEELRTTVLNTLQSVFESAANEKLAKWKKLGIVKPDKEKSLIDIDFLENGVPYIDLDDWDAKLALDMEYNYMLFKADVMKAFLGDPATFAKPTPEIKAMTDLLLISKGISNTAKLETIKNTYDNLFKRLTSLVAPGFQTPNKGDIHILHIDDAEYKSDNIDTYKKLFKKNQKLALEKLKSGKGSYNAVNRTDAQGFMTWASRLYQAKLEGIINEEQLRKFFRVFRENNFDAINEEITTTSYYDPSLKDILEFFNRDTEEKNGDLSGHKNFISRLIEHLRNEEITVDKFVHEISKLAEPVYYETYISRLEQYLITTQKVRKTSTYYGNIMESIKPVYAGNSQTEVNDEGETLFHMLYVKDSKFPLLPQITTGMDIDVLRKEMEQYERSINGNTDEEMLKRMLNNTFQMTFADHPSGIKVGLKRQIMSPYTETGLDQKFKIDKRSISVVDPSYYRIQQTNPDKPKLELTRPSQAVKLLFTNMLNEKFSLTKEDDPKLLDDIKKYLKDADVINYITPDSDGTLTGYDYRKLYNAIWEKIYDDALKQFNRDIKDSGPREFLKLVREEAIARDYPQAFVDALGYYNDQNIFEERDSAIEFLVNSPYSENLQNLLLSVFNSRVLRHPLPGKSYIAVTDQGFSLSQDNLEKLSNDIIYTKYWNGKSLASLKVNDSVTEITQNDQIFVPNYIIIDGEKIDLREFVKDGILDTSRIDDRILNTIGIRIPTQGLNSMSATKIAGFLPDYVGNISIVTSDMTVRKGMDFDFDKENHLHYYVRYGRNKKGEVTLTLDNTNSIKEAKNLISRIFWNVLNTVEASQHMTVPLDEHNLLEIATDIKKTRDKRFGRLNSFNPLTSNYDHDKYKSARIAKTGIGVTAMDGVFHSQAQGHGVTLKLPIVFGKLSNDVLGKEKTVDGEHYVSYIINANQSGMLDDPKTGIISMQELDREMLSVQSLLYLAGFTDEVPYFLAQDIIKDLMDAKASNDLYIKNEDYVAIKYLFLSQLAEQTSKRKILPFQRTYEEPYTGSNFSIENLKNQFYKGPVFENFSIQIFNEPTDLDNEFEISYMGQVFYVVYTGSVNFKDVPLDYFKFQSGILNQYLEYEKVGNTLTTIKNIFNIDATFVPKNIAEIFNKIIDLDVVKKQEQVNIKSMLVNTIMDSTITHGLLEAKNMMFEYFKDVEQLTRESIMDNFTYVWGENEDRGRIKPLIDEMLKGFVSYKYSKLYDDLHTKRKKLLLNSEENTSLGSYIAMVLSQDVKEQYKFFSGLDISNVENATQIRFRLTGTKDISSNSYIDSVFAFYQDDIDLPDLNGEKMTGRKLLSLLFDYSLVTDPRKGGYELLRILPYAYFETKNIKNRIIQNDVEMDTAFFIQFFQHNPQLLQKAKTFGLQNIKYRTVVDELGEPYEDTRQPLSFTLKDDVLPLMVQHNDTPYMMDSNGVYKIISTAGNFMMNEYSYELITPSGTVVSLFPEKNGTFTDVQGSDVDRAFERYSSELQKESDNTAQFINDLKNAIDKSKRYSKFSNVFYERVFKLLPDNLKVRVVNQIGDGKSNRVGEYNPDNETIEIVKSIYDNLNSTQQSKRNQAIGLIMHEIHHAILTKKVAKWVISNKRNSEILESDVENIVSRGTDFIKNTSLSSQEETLIYRLYKLYRDVKTAFESGDFEADNLAGELDVSFEYYLNDFEEFIMGAFTDPDFVKSFSNINVRIDQRSNAKISAWEKFKKLVKSIISAFIGDYNQVIDYTFQTYDDLLTELQNSSNFLNDSSMPISSKLSFAKKNVNDQEVDVSEKKKSFVNHSGGAEGSDSEFDKIGKRKGFPNHRHYTTAYLEQSDKKPPKGNITITRESLFEGFEKVKLASKEMWTNPEKKQDGFMPQPGMPASELTARNWQQVKNADAVFAIGLIVKKGEKPYGSKDNRIAKKTIVAGGTGYAVEMAIQHGKPVYVFEQSAKKWFTWNPRINSFVETTTPILTPNYAGIGTRRINNAGKKAIEELFENTEKYLKFSSTDYNGKSININYGKNQNAELSNFASRPFIVNEKIYASVEHAFQFAKFDFVNHNLLSDADKKFNENLREQFKEYANYPKKLKSLGSKIKGLDVGSWNANSKLLMTDLIRASFDQNPDAMMKLLYTGNILLTHTDVGESKGDGPNWETVFPEILMSVRSEFTEKETVDTGVQNNITIAEDLWTNETPSKNPDVTYVYTENLTSLKTNSKRVGKGSAVIRGNENAIGLVTKKRYIYKEDRFDEKVFKENLEELINQIKKDSSKLELPTKNHLYYVNKKTGQRFDRVSNLITPKKIIYTGLFVQNVELLKEKYKPVHPNVFYHHSTINFMPGTTSGIDVGNKQNIKVVGRLTTDKVDVLIVENSKSSNDYPHITLSTADGVPPYAPNEEIRNNLDKIEKLDDTVAVTEGYFDGTEDVISQNELLESASEIGTKIDTFFRDFFNGETVGKSTKELMSKYKITESKQEMKNLIKYANYLKGVFEEKGITIVPLDVTLSDEEYSVAGTVDLLGYDENGKLYIFDMKTMRGNHFQKTYRGENQPKYFSNTFGKSYYQKHQEQLSAYAIMLRNRYGLEVEEVGIIPIIVNYEPGETITSSIEGLPIFEHQQLDEINRLKRSYNTNLWNQNFSEDDYEEFVKINTEQLNKLTNKENIQFPKTIGGNLASLPTRFAVWLQQELLNRFNLESELNEKKDGLILKKPSARGVELSNPKADAVFGIVRKDLKYTNVTSASDPEILKTLTDKFGIKQVVGRFYYILSPEQKRKMDKYASRAFGKKAGETKKGFDLQGGEYKIGNWEDGNITLRMEDGVPYLYIEVLDKYVDEIDGVKLFRRPIIATYRIQADPILKSQEQRFKKAVRDNVPVPSYAENKEIEKYLLKTKGVSTKRAASYYLLMLKNLLKKELTKRVGDEYTYDDLKNLSEEEILKIFKDLGIENEIDKLSKKNIKELEEKDPNLLREELKALYAKHLQRHGKGKHIKNFNDIIDTMPDNFIRIVSMNVAHSGKSFFMTSLVGPNTDFSFGEMKLSGIFEATAMNIVLKKYVQEGIITEEQIREINDILRLRAVDYLKEIKRLESKGMVLSDELKARIRSEQLDKLDLISIVTGIKKRVFYKRMKQEAFYTKKEAEKKEPGLFRLINMIHSSGLDPVTSSIFFTADIDEHFESAMGTGWEATTTFLHEVGHAVDRYMYSTRPEDRAKLVTFFQEVLKIKGIEKYIRTGVESRGYDEENIKELMADLFAYVNGKALGLDISKGHLRDLDKFFSDKKEQVDALFESIFGKTFSVFENVNEYDEELPGIVNFIRKIINNIIQHVNNVLGSDVFKKLDLQTKTISTTETEIILNDFIDTIYEMIADEMTYDIRKLSEKEMKGKIRRWSSRFGHRKPFTLKYRRELLDPSTFLSARLEETFNAHPILSNDYRNEDLQECIGKPKAKHGVKTNNSGSGWEIVKDFKGKPKHSQGGVDIEITDKGIKLSNSNVEIKAKNGLIILKDEK